jgi:hypothetical protein
LAVAINRIEQQLKNMPNTTFAFAGQTYSTAQVVAQITNTSWRITDAVTYNNNGVGSAAYGNGGQNVDSINYQSILGAGYGSSNYPNFEGLTALALHELGHLNPIGFSFQNRSIDAYKSRNAGRSDGYYSSSYARNVEAFANDFMVSLAAAGGFDITIDSGLVIPGGHRNAVDPSAVIYP